MIFLANDPQIVRDSAVGFSLPVADDSEGLTPDFRHSLARHSVAGIDASSVILCGNLGRLRGENRSVDHASRRMLM